jgi:hypothetical protein
MDIYTLCFTFPSIHLPDGTSLFHPSDDTLTTHTYKPSFSNNQTPQNSSGGRVDEDVVPFSTHDQTIQYTYPASTAATSPTPPDAAAAAEASHDDEFEAVHHKCLAISSKTGCLVSAVILPPSPPPSSSSSSTSTAQQNQDRQKGQRHGAHGWEFQLSGGYEQVMSARRMVMGEFKPLVSVLPYVTTTSLSCLAVSGRGGRSGGVCGKREEERVTVFG